MDRYLYHYTTAADWLRSLADGEHTMSARGASLDEIGFIHFCYASQRAGVWQRYWADLDLAQHPVVLLTVDPEDLDPGALVDENTSGGTERFPHLYCALPVGAVVSVQDVAAEGKPTTR